MKNVLAVANVLARKTFSGSDRQTLQRYSDRLTALAFATDMLGVDEADEADLRELIGAVLKPHVPEGRMPFALSGPRVTIGPKTASNIAMAIHELATNAAKYGALSGEAGSVSINWAKGPATLKLWWREHDGPPVVPPARTGFGSLLIGQALFHAPNKSEISFDPDGVQWELVLEEGILE